MDIAPTIFMLLAAAATLWLVLAWRSNNSAWKPAELRAAKLIAVEQDFTIDEPRPVVGRPDQVYRRPDGKHLLVELKNRDRYVVYATDIAEISLRAWLLRSNGMPTAEHGYVAINKRGTAQRQPVKVILKTDAECEALFDRYLKLRAGTANPRRSRGPKCTHCGHKPVCHSTPTF